VPLIPLFPLDLVLFPGLPLPLHIFEPRYKQMINECLDEKHPFGIVRAKDSSVADVGCTAAITEVVKRYGDGRLDILSEGLQRFEIMQLDQERPYLRGEVTFFDDATAGAPAAQQSTAQRLHADAMELIGGDAEPEGSDSAKLSFRLAASLPTDLDFKQTLLGMRSEEERLATLIEYYEAVIPKLKQVQRARKIAGGNGHAR
jgi:Lon protease-like protein